MDDNGSSDKDQEMGGSPALDPALLGLEYVINVFHAVVTSCSPHNHMMSHDNPEHERVL